MAGGPLPCTEDQRKLLHDARATRDAFVQERARVENLLNSALEKVKIYQAQLGATESRICKVEDLIGSIRFRLCERGVSANPITRASLLPTPDKTINHESSTE